MRKIGKEGNKGDKWKKWEKEWDIDTKGGRERESEICREGWCVRERE